MSRYDNGPELDAGAAAYEVGRFDYHDTARADHRVSPEPARGPITVPVDPSVWGPLGGVYVILVQLPGGRSRRRVFLTLAAAEKCARRARERGEHARLVLCRISPAGEVAP